jgi:uncharacterized protein (TIGR03435 family)
MRHACILGALTMRLSGSALPQGAPVQPHDLSREALQFEVATIKPSAPGVGSSSTNSTNGFLQITNQTLRTIIQYAYNVRDFQISGGPGWMGSDRYDVAAKPENGAHDQQMKQMLQTLLSDRFQLRFHRETREGTVYALFVGKNGPRLQPAKKSDSSGITSGRNSMGLSTLSGKRASLDEIAANLSARLGRPVFDKTGLTDKFDFELSWVQDLTPSGAGAPSPAVSGPSLFTAVQEQLGLRLESQKGPVEILVIDQVSRPQEN